MNSAYYSVKEKIFFNKIDAILYANNDLSDVNWHFHQDLFNKHDWSVEPELTLDYYYKIRAQEIRNQFDYVVILCSGGADSTNVLKTFINNNIAVDEIIASAPLEGIKNYKFNNVDCSNSNTISETVYTQIPLINEIANSSSKIRITLHDYFKDIRDYKTDEWLYRCDDWIHPSSAARYRFERIDHLRKLAESNKKIAFVYGIDKPILLMDKLLDIFILFSDLAVNVQRPAFDREYPNVKNVLFYWDSTTADLVTKQAHVVAKWLFKSENKFNKQFLNDLRWTGQKSFEFNRLRHSKYERAIVPCIYPTTYRPIFQAEKPTKLFLGEHDDWFYKLHDKTNFYEMIVSDTKSFYKTINSKYLNSAKNGFAIYYNAYKIGNYGNFTL